MRKYGSIHTKFWTHPEIQQTSDQTKLLAAYLLSSSHTNMLGCFRVPIGYIAEDLRWSVDLVKKALHELSAINFLTYDETYSWVSIHTFLKYNPIENPNQGKSLAKLFNDIPNKASFIPQVIDQLLVYSEYLQKTFLNSLETLAKPFRNQDQEQNQEQNQEQELILSGKPDAGSLCDDEFVCDDKLTAINDSKTSFKTQAMEVLSFLNEKTGRVYRPVDVNLKLIIARLKSGASLIDCRQVIAKKTREWKRDPKMAEYLRPATLFNATKFEQYVGELVEPDEGSEMHEHAESLS